MLGFKKSLRTMLLICVIASTAVMSAYAADVSVGTVDASGLRLRERPEIGSKILDTASEGDAVVVFAKEGDWYKVSYNGSEGYMYAEYLNVAEDADAVIGTGIVSGSVVNMRAEPSLDAEVLRQLVKGTSVKIVGVQDGWYKVQYGSVTGYMSPDYVTPAKTTLASRSGSSSDSAAITVSSDATQLCLDVVTYAKSYLGVKYVYGGSTPKGFDCSGFTQYVLKHFGYTISRTASTQYKYGTSVSKSALRAGDLVFFSAPGKSSIAHVGIYVGGNSFIHASSPGDVVKITSLSNSYYVTYYVGARRIID